MDYWTKRGFSLNGTRFTGIWIASKKGKHAVLRMNWFNELVHINEEEFYFSEGQAMEAAKEAALANA